MTKTLYEAIRSGRVVVAPDTDISVVNEINEYNERMSECRAKKAFMDEIALGNDILNPLVVFCLSFVRCENVFANPYLGAGILAVYAALFVIFAIGKSNFIVSTAASTLLIFLDWTFAILLAADVILLLLDLHFRLSLKKERAYPHFRDIQIKFENPGR